MITIPCPTEALINARAALTYGTATADDIAALEASHEWQDVELLRMLRAAERLHIPVSVMPDELAAILASRRAHRRTVLAMCIGFAVVLTVTALVMIDPAGVVR